MGRYCSQCGSQVRHGAVYCVECGAILSDDPPSRPIPLFPFRTNIGVMSYKRREAMFDMEGIRTIRASCKVFNVKVASADTEKIRLGWDETSSWGVAATQAEGELQVNEQNYLGLHNLSDYVMQHQRKDLLIELPKAYRGALVLENEAGSIAVDDLESDGAIELRTAIGPIKARNLKAGKDFRADTTGGGLDISNVASAQTVLLSSMTMTIQADRVKAGAGISVTSTSGRCLLRELESAEYLSIAASVGQVVLDSAKASKIDIGVSGSGLVDCKGIFAKEDITITSATGSITCEIDDDKTNYSTRCRSVHGHCNLPEAAGGGPKVLRISTGVGNIDVRFREDSGQP